MTNRQLYIDKEAVITLALVKEGLLSPVTKLMNESEANAVDKSGKINGKSFPFSFILAPNGKTNETVLKNCSKSDVLELVCEGKVYGKIITDEVFKIDIDSRVKKIYGTNNPDHIGVRDTYRRLGNYAISGEYLIDFPQIHEYKQRLQNAIKATNAKRISSIMVSANPFHRVHERLIRTALVKCDLMVIFILKPYTDVSIPYDTRYESLQYFCDNFLPRDRVVIIPLENTYIFGGLNELMLNALVAKNFGCNELIIGQNHAGLGAYYDKEGLSSVIDTLDVDIDIDIMSKFVYCDKCKTLVSTNACPHGRHHHINYHSKSILELLQLGIIPPAILMRKELSSIILSSLFPERVKQLAKIHQKLSPSSGLLDDFSDSDFYESLMNLYQTSSLT